MQKVIVASTNPVKINIAKVGFAKMFPDLEFEVEGIAVPSEVSDQPMSEEETQQGAINRAENASMEAIDADFWVGIEGGVDEFNGSMECLAWIVVKSKDGRMGKGRSSSFLIPDKISELIKGGMEMGEADDIVFGRSNSKQGNGLVGILTNDVLTRSTYYEPAMILALIPFKNPELY